MRDHEVIQVKKYPNRRYYDATRSRHVTLQDVQDLIVAGHDVCITDSRNGDDITNVVLMQILLERDQPKLDLFPSSVLHVMIRSNRQVLRTMLERFFGPFWGMMANSQRQFDTYLRQAMHGVVNPLEWAGGMMEAFGRSSRASSNGSTGPEPSEPDDPGQPNLDELRAQLAAILQRIEALSEEKRQP
ncbi:MAG: polyhydroxyalkanoate synthesis regulator DNA-binding domain-containing protein [Planctomycetota bacterium]